MQSPVPILIAAAGIGSRLGMNLPKCLVEVHGRSLLERLLTDVLADEPDVRLIVGFRADEVIAAARAVRDDVLFVRNPSFRDTSVRHSFWLAARHLDRPCIIIDGDTLIDPESWRAFRRACETQSTIVGVTPASTTDAVFTAVDEGSRQVTGFTRARRLAHEWCGVAQLDPVVFDAGVEYVYECIERVLPAPAHVLNVAEVDTPDDLRHAVALAQHIDARCQRVVAFTPPVALVAQAEAQRRRASA